MKWFNQHTFFRSLIILLMICLAMPCSAKQDFKQALNIPTYENLEKPNKTTTCQITTEKTSQKTSITQQKATENNFFSAFYTPLFEQISTLQFSEQPQSTLVPIYILHEQYRL